MHRRHPQGPTAEGGGEAVQENAVGGHQLEGLGRVLQQEALRLRLGLRLRLRLASSLAPIPLVVVVVALAVALALALGSGLVPARRVEAAPAHDPSQAEEVLPRQAVALAGVAPEDVADQDAVGGEEGGEVREGGEGAE